MANRATDVGRDLQYWSRFYEKYQVATRPGTKKDGTPTKYRRDVELGSLACAIDAHAADFKAATPEQQGRRNAIREKLRNEFGLTEELRQELLEVE